MLKGERRGYTIAYGAHYTEIKVDGKIKTGASEIP